MHEWTFRGNRKVVKGTLPNGSYFRGICCYRCGLVQRVYHKYAYSNIPVFAYRNQNENNWYLSKKVPPCVPGNEKEPPDSWADDGGSLAYEDA